MYDVKKMIDNALNFADNYEDVRATSDVVITRSEAGDSDITKLAAALSFIADNLDDLEPTAEEKLAEAELLMSYYADEQAEQEQEQIKTAYAQAEQEFSRPAARDRLANLLGR